jgi:hypothetical protein
VNLGTAGAGTALIGSEIGGTAGWTGLQAVSFGVSDYKLNEGEMVGLRYDEEGTGTFTQMTIQLDLVF